MFNKLLTFIKEVHIITNDSKRYDLYISNKNAKIEVKVTDRFGNVYTEAVENK